VNRTIRAAVTALVAAVLTLPVALISGAGQATAAGCVTAAQLHAAAVRGDTSAARLAVDYAAGTADYITAAPLCQTMWATGAQNAYWVGARAIPGHGAALWPQQLAAHTVPQPLTGAGHHPFRIPVVRDECGQTDVSVSDRPQAWPLVQRAPGTPQPPTRYFVPGTPGERVGNGRGCFPPPAVTVARSCPACVGSPTLAVTVANRAPYAQIRLIPVVNGRRLGTITLAAGRSTVIRIPVRDGDQWALYSQTGWGRWTNPARIVGDAILCPPPPRVVITVACDCGPAVHASVTATNAGRYYQDYTVTAGPSRHVFRVSPHGTGSYAFTFTRGSTVTVTAQSFLPGHLVGGPVRAAQVTAS
jgi:hypothetical protein